MGSLRQKRLWGTNFMVEIHISEVDKNSQTSILALILVKDSRNEKRTTSRTPW